jgi:hypothetical protein
MARPTKKVLQMMFDGQTFILNGEKDFVIASTKPALDLKQKADFVVQDPSFEGLLLRIKFMHGTAFLIADPSLGPVDTYKTIAPYYKLD